MAFIQGIRCAMAVAGQYDIEFQIKIGLRKMRRAVGLGFMAASGAAPVLYNRNMLITAEDAAGDAVAELIAVSCFVRIEFADVGGLFRRDGEGIQDFEDGSGQGSLAGQI